MEISDYKSQYIPVTGTTSKLRTGAPWPMFHSDRRRLHHFRFLPFRLRTVLLAHTSNWPSLIELHYSQIHLRIRSFLHILKKTATANQVGTTVVDSVGQDQDSFVLLSVVMDLCAGGLIDRERECPTIIVVQITHPIKGAMRVEWTYPFSLWPTRRFN